MHSICDVIYYLYMYSIRPPFSHILRIRSSPLRRPRSLPISTDGGEGGAHKSSQGSG